MLLQVIVPQAGAAGQDLDTAYAQSLQVLQDRRSFHDQFYPAVEKDDRVGQWFHLAQRVEKAPDEDVPQLGVLHVTTELGKLRVAPGEIVVIPRNLRFSVSPEGSDSQQTATTSSAACRGYMLEVFASRGFVLPELGPIGANGLAEPRDFLSPVAAYEDRACPNGFTITTKYAGELFDTVRDHSPYGTPASRLEAARPRPTPLHAHATCRSGAAPEPRCTLGTPPLPPPLSSPLPHALGGRCRRMAWQLRAIQV